MQGQATNEVKRLPLAVSPSNRDDTTSRDAKLINGYIEQVSENEVWVYKRPGFSTFSTATAVSVGRGIYNWLGDIYSIWDNHLYKNNVVISGTLDTTNDGYTFNSILGSTPKLFLQNGVKAYTYDGTNGLVNVTDTNYVAFSPTIKGQAYLDGTTYVMTPKAVINGSNINDPQTWGASNNLIAQIEPDAGVFVAKQLVYVIAFKQWSVEVFYDAGNATGSPLGPVQGAKINVGCRAGGTVQDIEGTLFWVAQARSGSVSVYAMDGLKATPISTPAIDRLLEAGDYSAVYSWGIKMGGHKFYGITLKNSNLTLVYDLSSRLWYQWTDTNGNYLPIVSATFSPGQYPLVQHESNGKIYTVDDMVFTDDGQLILFDLYTPNYDGGSRKRKYCGSMDFIADQTNGSIMTVRKTDDDYQTWSNFRTVDLSKPRPKLTSMGTFRRRAWHFRHRCNTGLRIQAIELHLEMGVL